MDKIMTKQEERDFVMKLLKAGGAGPSEKETIFQLYKKYLEPNHLSWTDSACSSCSSSIQLMWTKVRDFILSEKFTIE
jgi:tRNA uridine 5-carbamoylmethylation protein Kti12